MINRNRPSLDDLAAEKRQQSFLDKTSSDTSRKKASPAFTRYAVAEALLKLVEAELLTMDQIKVVPGQKTQPTNRQICGDALSQYGFHVTENNQYTITHGRKLAWTRLAKEKKRMERQLAKEKKVIGDLVEARKPAPELQEEHLSNGKLEPNSYVVERQRKLVQRDLTAEEFAKRIQFMLDGIKLFGSVDELIGHAQAYKEFVRKVQQYGSSLGNY